MPCHFSCTNSQALGELDASKDSERLASLLQVQVMGLRAYARTNKEANIKDIDRGRICDFVLTRIAI